jgi:hypothetical protein
MSLFGTLKSNKSALLNLSNALLSSLYKFQLFLCFAKIKINDYRPMI